jgi:hypothetical protein
MHFRTPLGPTTAGILASNVHLEEAAIHGVLVDQATFRALALHPELYTVNVENAIDELFLCKPPDANSNDAQHIRVFASLLILRAGAHEPSLVGPAISSIDSDRLWRLLIYSEALCSADSFTSIGAALAAHPSYDGLEDLTLSFGPLPYHITPHSGVSEDEVERYMISVDTMKPLFQLPYISSFTLHSPYLRADDAVLAGIAKHWPLLQELHLSERTFVLDHLDGRSPAVTFAGLDTLLLACTGLTHISVVIDTSSAVEWLTGLQTAQRLSRHTKRCMISVGYSDLSEPHISIVALALAWRFVEVPEVVSHAEELFKARAERMQWGDEDFVARGEERDLRWKEVKRQLPEMYARIAQTSQQAAATRSARADANSSSMV